jgi:hypothetical protein
MGAAEMSEWMEGEWIPVEERLPDLSGKYLVTATDGDEFVDIAYFDREAFNGEGCFDYGDVLAWVPLPTPYTDENTVTVTVTHSVIDLGDISVSPWDHDDE